MKSWLNNLQQREQLVLSVGSLLGGLIILWVFVWVPLTTGTSELRDTVVEKQRFTASLHQAQTVAGDQPTQAPAETATASLILIVDQTLREHGLTSRLQRNQPDGPDGIRVTFQQASFDSLVEWLIVLHQSHGVSVESANFDSERQTGLVAATLVLRRS